MGDFIQVNVSNSMNECVSFEKKFVKDITIADLKVSPPQAIGTVLPAAAHAIHRHITNTFDFRTISVEAGSDNRRQCGHHANTCVQRRPAGRPIGQR